MCVIIADMLELEKTAMTEMRCVDIGLGQRLLINGYGDSDFGSRGLRKK